VRPLIGVTTSEVRNADSPTHHGEPPQREMTLGLPYLRAIELAGGLPVVLPPLGADAIGELLDRLDGVCLSGGPDLHPGGYQSEPHPELGPVWPWLDQFEIELARGADARELPVLGICRGAQALNVARGGTLHQHLPDVTDGSIEHRQRAPARRSTHDVVLQPGSAVARILGGESAAVNSFHHQAIAVLGAQLVAVAHARDGVVEAIEATDRRAGYFTGVQWHAEGLVDRGSHLGLFADLIAAASR
jgi:putative glutamine amidotransferase